MACGCHVGAAGASGAHTHAKHAAPRPQPVRPFIRRFHVAAYRSSLSAVPAGKMQRCGHLAAALQHSERFAHAATSIQHRSLVAPPSFSPAGRSFSKRRQTRAAAGGPPPIQTAASEPQPAPAPVPATPEEASDSRWPTVVALSTLVALVCSIDRAAMSVAILPMAEEYGWSDSTKGAVGALFLRILLIERCLMHCLP